MKSVMNIDEVKFDDVEENDLYTSSRGQISGLSTASGTHTGPRRLVVGCQGRLEAGA